MTRTQLGALLASMALDGVLAFALVALAQLGVLQSDPQHTSTWAYSVLFAGLAAWGPMLTRKLGLLQGWLDKLSTGPQPLTGNQQPEQDPIIDDEDRVPNVVRHTAGPDQR